MNQKSQAKTILTHYVTEANAVVAKHAERLVKEPYEALLWVNSVVEAAARIHVFGAVLASMEKGTSEADILTVATSRVQQLARSGMRKSTAVLDQSLETEQLRAWAMVVERFTEELGVS